MHFNLLTCGWEFKLIYFNAIIILLALKASNFRKTPAPEMKVLTRQALSLLAANAVGRSTTVPQQSSATHLFYPHRVHQTARPSAKSVRRPPLRQTALLPNSSSNGIVNSRSLLGKCKR